MRPEVELVVIIAAGLCAGFPLVVVVILAEIAQLRHRFGVSAISTRSAAFPSSMLPALHSAMMLARARALIRHLAESAARSPGDDAERDRVAIVQRALLADRSIAAGRCRYHRPVRASS